MPGSGPGPGLDRLLAGPARRPLLLDAAMGTRLIARGLDLGREDPCLWNLDRPEAVLDVHRRDLRAGSEALLTNTFGANRVALARLGRAGDAVAINRRAVGLARAAAGSDRFVLGVLGPTAARHADAYREQADALLSSGVDGLILETQDLDTARLGLGHLRGLGDLPRLVSLSDPRPLPAGEALRLVDLGASALGANCLVGMGPMLAMADRLRREVAVPLIAEPSAGLPGEPPVSPESFASAVPRLVALGVRLIGGCCGSDETHIAALRAALDALGEPGS